MKIEINKIQANTNNPRTIKEQRSQRSCKKYFKNTMKKNIKNNYLQ